MEQLINNILAQGYNVEIAKPEKGFSVSAFKFVEEDFDESRVVIKLGNTALEALQKAWEQIQEIER